MAIWRNIRNLSIYNDVDGYISNDYFGKLY